MNFKMPAGEAPRQFVGDIGRLLASQGTYRDQIDAIQRSAVWALPANIMVIAAVAMLFWASPLRQTALVWSAIGVALSLGSLVAWHKSRNVEPATADLPGIANFMTFFAGLRSFHWAAGLIMLLPEAEPTPQFVMGWILAGMLCGGTFAYSTLPRAALAYIAVMGSGGAVAMLLTGETTLVIAAMTLVVFCAFLFMAAIINTRLFRSHIEHEATLSEQNEFMGILLKDFEDSASDWLWESGPDLRLRRGAGRFTQNLDYSVDGLEQHELLGFMRERARTDAQTRTLHNLSRAFAAQKSFSDIMVHFGEGHLERYWQFSAKPIADLRGGWRGVARDLTVAQKSQKKITYLAHHDALTGLPNRVQLRESLGKAIVDFSASGASSWVICIDLDGFKSVNDLFGHLTGDRVLTAVAKRLLGGIGTNDVLSRMGGDEFIVLCRGLGGAKDITAYATRLLPLVSEPLEIIGPNLHVGASIGIARVGHDGNSVSEILRNADLALYRAKHLGKGVVCVFEISMDRDARARRALEHDLKLAVERNEFVLHYQPIVAMADGRLSGREALIRWQHPVRGMVAPGEFISVAEEIGVIVQIGEWVILEACRQAALWPKGVRVSVNLAPLQIKGSQLLASVVRALDETGLPGSQLELEITESAVLENTDIVLDNLKKLKALGVRIGLDDFGTGYSSLGYLHQFGFDNIKIDRSFVQAMATRSESKAVVKAVLMLARELGISTTAEGIETQEQFNLLKSRGCHEAQGYFLGRPEPLPVNADEQKRAAPLTS